MQLMEVTEKEREQISNLSNEVISCAKKFVIDNDMKVWQVVASFSSVMESLVVVSGEVINEPEVQGKSE